MPEGFVGGFEDQGDIFETGVGGDFFEEFDAQISGAEGGVPVEVSAEGAFGIIEVHPAEIFQTDEAVEFGEAFFEAFVVRQVITGGESVTGIDTYAGSVGHAGFFQHIGELFKRVSEIAALTGGIFEDGADAGDFPEGGFHGIGDDLASFSFGNEFEVAAGVEIEHGQSEGGAAL